jgi:hypothetical protein
MNARKRPYWITTDPPIGLGVGVTAYSEDDAQFLFGSAWPSVHKILRIQAIEDMRNIDQNHVAPNMEDWVRRGIWFPKGYTHISR